MNNLKYFRERVEMSQMELANKTGLEQSRIARVEAGGVDFKGQQWKLIADALDCTVDELVGRRV